MKVKFSATGIGRIEATASTLTAAVEHYTSFRDRHGLRSSELGNACVRDGNKVVAWISYNGRLWTAKPGTPAAKPMTLVVL